MKLKEFFDTDFKEFSLYDNVRSIPSLYDGLKVSQRKILHSLMKKGDNAEEMRVSVTASYVSAESKYVHGEASLLGAIVGLAQNFSGGNNLNYLEPNGQFGSRLSNEAASGRYIYTKLNSNFRKIFSKQDDCILNLLKEEGETIEPDYLIPIIPNILINGAIGVGTGYAVDVLMYNPNDLKENTLKILNQKKASKLIPWYKDFTGEVTTNPENGQWLIKGKFERENSTTIKVTELPIGTFQQDYKAHLSKLIDSNFIKDYDDYSTEERFEFVLTVPRTTTSLDDDTLMQKLKLISKASENITLWVSNGNLKVFSNANEVLNYFVEWRITKYEQRRITRIKLLQEDLKYQTEKLRFIEFYIKNSEMFAKKNKKDLEALLINEGFTFIDELMSLKIYNLTLDEIEKLKRTIIKVTNEIQALKNTNATEMYIKELEELQL